MAQYPDIRSTTVVTDATRPFLKMNNRYAYIKTYYPFWKERIRYRAYCVLLALVGIYFLFVQPLLAAVAFAGSAYYWQMYDHRGMVIGSARQVLLAK